MAIQNLSVTFGLPSQELFTWSPNDAPQTILPRPQDVPKRVQPFIIHPAVFRFFLEPKVPITIAAIYLVSVVYLNRLNDSRQNRPWNFTKTWTFKALVLCHNIFLALFSALIFYGLCHMLCGVWLQKTESNTLAHVADFLCRINGPTGPEYTRESSPDTNISIQFHSTRLWSNGYAYLSWIFYISKFYEVVDTLIILAKGKKTSILQMYHHAGVMICAWSGVRYMSPPSVVGIFLNSGIHTLMYSYYALTALAFPISSIIKRTLTSLQIAQFIVGCTIACGYFFVEYDTLVYRSASHRTAVPSTSIDANIISSYPPTMPSVSEESRLGSNPRNQFEIQRIPCLQDSGQAFAVWLSTLYCLPLIYLFVCFFSRSYLKHVKGISK